MPVFCLEIDKTVKIVKINNLFRHERLLMHIAVLMVMPTTACFECTGVCNVTKVHSSTLKIILEVIESFDKIYERWWFTNKLIFVFTSSSSTRTVHCQLRCITYPFENWYMSNIMMKRELDLYGVSHCCKCVVITYMFVSLLY